MRRSEEVAAYYDAHSRRFLKYGQGGRVRVLHRAVWGEGVGSREEAFNYIHRLILEEVERHRADLIVDLGCGVGASLLYLARKWKARYIGVTLSGVQERMARRNVEAEGHSDRCLIARGDFLDKLEVLACARPSAAFAIESFVHGRDPKLFFQRVSELLCPGGLLMVCDDFLIASPGSKRLSRRLREFRRGWRISSLLTTEEAEGLAAPQGFQLTRREDLTSYLELDRPRDILIRALVPLARPLIGRSVRWSHLFGGNALQICLKAGVISYQFLVFRKE
jgi:predicted O-methyltransferase YrrM